DLDTRITEVTATADGAAAAIVVETTARVSADEALAEQITTLTADVGAVNAAVSNEALARANADTALAGQITSVDAKANRATANGQVFLAAKAAPTGAVA